MRIPSLGTVTGRFTLALTLIAGSAILVNANKPQPFSVHEKAYYADTAKINFVRPGLVMKIVTASVANDGTLSVRYKLSDPRGLGLDRLGVETPGTVAVSFIGAYIPKNGSTYVAYTTRTQTSPITNVTALQSSGDTGGTTQQVAIGEYIYTFATKAVPSGGGTFDKTATHSIGIYGSRNLTEFDLGTNYASDVFSWVPDGSKVTQVREVIKTSTCNDCHDSVGFHGGSRRGMETCILCHTPTNAKSSTNIDPDTGNTFDMAPMIHRIHAGEELPSVIAGKKYQIIGNAQNVSDWSTVAFPAVGGARNCEMCHDQTTGAAQKDAYLKATRAACGSCHDNVNFATGENHANLPQVSDGQCTTCHTPQGELEFDVSIKGAHLVDHYSTQNPGLNFNITKVENGSAGRKPTVTFTLKDNKGNGIPLANVTTGNARNRIALVLSGPTSDYGYTNFGSDVTTNGYVSEDPTTGASAAKCANDGTCTYTFNHGIPADAKGSFTVSIEGRLDINTNPGTKQARFVEFAGTGKTVAMSFSVDGSPVVQRRKVVDIAKCNQCHGFLSLHGENRNAIEQCVVCHNPSETDAARRPVAVNAADKAKPNQAISMAFMAHRIHMGERAAELGGTNPYVVVGFGGSHNDFSEVRYPVFSPNGQVRGQNKCYMCHVNGSEAILPVGKNNVRDPQGLVTTVPNTTSACIGCHQAKSALAHAQLNTSATLGESCDVCHGTGAEFDATKMHAN